MTAFVSGSDFGRQVAIRVAIFVTIGLGFSFIVVGFLFLVAPLLPHVIARFAISNASIIFAAAFVLSLIGPCTRRMRTLSLPGWWGLFVPLLIAPDAVFLISAMAISSSLPLLSHAYGSICVVAALTLVVAMMFAFPPSDSEPQGLARFGLAGIAVSILAVGAVAIAYIDWAVVVATKSILPDPGSPVKFPDSSRIAQLSSIHSALRLLKIVVCLPLSVLFIWLAVVSRRNGENGGIGGREQVVNSSGQAPRRSMSARTVFGKR